MNRPFLSLLTLLALLGAGLPAAAQTSPSPPLLEERPLPPGPILSRAPEYSQWTMTYTCTDASGKPITGKPAPGASSPGTATISIRMTKTENIYHEEILSANGTKREIWHIGDLQIDPVANSEELAVYDPSSFPHPGGKPLYNPEYYTDYSQSDFPGLQWLSPRTYLGVEKIKDTEYLVFRQGPAPTSTSNVSTTVLIDPQTHLPVQIKSPQVEINYLFGDAPTSLQELPRNVKALLIQRFSLIRSLTTRPHSY